MDRRQFLAGLLAVPAAVVFGDVATATPDPAYQYTAGSELWFVPETHSHTPHVHSRETRAFRNRMWDQGINVDCGEWVKRNDVWGCKFTVVGPA